MEDWIKLSCMLCIFGIIREFRPSEPFVTKYLNNAPMNFTLKEIYRDIYPVGTYSTMILLIFIFLCTDVARYKSILILNGLCGLAIYVMLITCREIFWIQVMEVLYGLFTACDVAYCTYIYAKVDKVHYQKVTSHTHSAYLVGRAISGIASQLLISVAHVSYYDLNFYTVTGMILATLWAFLLPPVDKTVYFHREENKKEEMNEINSTLPPGRGFFLVEAIKKGLKFLLRDCTTAFTNTYVLKWAIWWALATCGYYQVLSYMQVLWEEIAKESNDKLNSNWNGAVEATYTILSAMASFGCGMVKVRWKVHGELILALFSASIGFTLLVASRTMFIIVAYAADIFSKILYHAMITIANSEVAQNINPDSYALIFGITTFIALVLQSILTFVVNTTLELPARSQFLIYSTYFILLGIFFLLIPVLKYLKRRIFPAQLSQDEIIRL